MRKLVPTVLITVVREGKLVTPPIGKAFAFTAEEIKDVGERHPGAMRKPVNESADEEVAETVDASAKTAPKLKDAKVVKGDESDKAPAKTDDDDL